MEELVQELKNPNYTVPAPAVSETTAVTSEYSDLYHDYHLLDDLPVPIVHAKDSSEIGDLKSPLSDRDLPGNGDGKTQSTRQAIEPTYVNVR